MALIPKLIRITSFQATLLARESSRRQQQQSSVRRQQTGRGMEAAIIREAIDKYFGVKGEEADV